MKWWQIAFKSCLPLFCQNYMFSNSLSVYKQSHMTQHMPRALCHLSKPAVIASWQYSVVGCLLVLVIIALFYRKFENNYSLCYKTESSLCLVCFERGHYWLDIIDELIYGPVVLDILPVPMCSHDFGKCIYTTQCEIERELCDENTWWFWWWICGYWCENSEWESLLQG